MAKGVFVNVQALRGVAALLVAAYHLQPMLNAAYGTHLDYHFGAFGVDIFFVISGFVMYHSASIFSKPISSFLLARFFRVVPMYWLATMLVVIVYSLGFHPNGLNAFKPYMLLQSIAFVRTHFPDDRYDLILSLGWTLIYELFFYAIFAMTFITNAAGRSLLVVAATFATLVVLGRLFDDGPPNLIYFTDPIIFEFVLGGFLALAVRQLDRDRIGQFGKAALPSAVAVIAGVTIVIAMELVLGAAVPRDMRSLVWGLPATLIVGGMLGLERAGFPLPSAKVFLLGAASYMLYLFHPVTMQATVKAIAKLVPIGDTLGMPIAAVAALSAAIGVALAVHRTIEIRILELGRRLVDRLGDTSAYRVLRIEKPTVSSSTDTEVKD